MSRHALSQPPAMLLLSSEAASPQKTPFEFPFRLRAGSIPLLDATGTPGLSREVTQLLGPGHQHSLADEMGGKKNNKSHDVMPA